MIAFLPQLLGGIGGTIGGLIWDAVDNSDEEAERRARQNQQLALEQYQNLGQYAPDANLQGYLAAQSPVRGAAQQEALSQIAYGPPDKRKRRRQGY